MGVKCKTKGKNDKPSCFSGLPLNHEIPYSLVNRGNNSMNVYGSVTFHHTTFLIPFSFISWKTSSEFLPVIHLTLFITATNRGIKGRNNIRNKSSWITWTGFPSFTSLSILILFHHPLFPARKKELPPEKEKTREKERERSSYPVVSKEDEQPH